MRDNVWLQQKKVTHQYDFLHLVDKCSDLIRCDFLKSPGTHVTSDCCKSLIYQMREKSGNWILKYGAASSVVYRVRMKYVLNTLVRFTRMFVYMATWI